MWRNSGWTVWHIQDIIPLLHKYLFCIQKFFVPRHRLQRRNCRRKLVPTIKAISIIASLLWKMAVDCKILKSHLVKYCRSSYILCKVSGDPLTNSRYMWDKYPLISFPSQRVQFRIIISFLNISNVYWLPSWLVGESVHLHSSQLEQAKLQCKTWGKEPVFLTPIRPHS